jgi:hypothetical protein
MREDLQQTNNLQQRQAKMSAAGATLALRLCRNPLNKAALRQFKKETIFKI